MGKLLFKTLAIMCAVTILIIPLNATAQTKNKAITEKITDICTLTASVYPKSDDMARILSYNVLAEGPGFGGTPCEERKEGMLSILTLLHPDILCLQEVSRGWFTIIKDNTDYTAINSLETEITGLMTALLYNTETVALEEWGTETFTTGEDYRLRRAVWGLFRIKSSGRMLCVVNAHLNITKDTDTYSGGQAMDLISITEKLRNSFTCPIFVAGDFNAKKRTSVTNPSSSIYEILTRHLVDSSDVAELISTGDTKTKPTTIADHVFITGDAKIKRYVILSNKVFLNISDHYPLFVDAEFN